MVFLWFYVGFAVVSPRFLDVFSLFSYCLLSVLWLFSSGLHMVFRWFCYRALFVIPCSSHGSPMKSICFLMVFFFVPMVFLRISGGLHINILCFLIVFLIISGGLPVDSIFAHNLPTVFLFSCDRGACCCCCCFSGHGTEKYFWIIQPTNSYRHPTKSCIFD